MNKVVDGQVESGFYVYTLARPDGRVFYVGKGRGKRIDAHESQARHGKLSKKCNIIRKIWASGGQVEKAIVFRTESEREALDYEIRLIASFTSGELANLTRGGDGVIGYRFTAKARAKISAAGKGRKPTPEACANVSAALMGHSVSEETKAKIAERAKANARTPEGRRRLIRSSQLAKKPEAKAKQMAGRRMYFASWDRRIKHREERRVLSREQVAAIRQQYEAGQSQVMIAASYNLAQVTVSRIVRKETYSDW